MEASEDVFTCDEVGGQVLQYLSHDDKISRQQLNTWLRTPPEWTVVRVNTSKTTRDSAKNSLYNHFDQDAELYDINEVPGTDEVLYVTRKSGFKSKVNVIEYEVIVDEMCGLAVLRGANVFAPGILSISPGALPECQVSVYADLDRKCLRGLAKPYTGRKVHVGNGRLLVSREDVFRDNVRGNGVIMEERLFGCPSIDERMLGGEVMLQNLPSILAVLELDPQPGDRVLDMCSAPGGKTMHIASRMKNSGIVIALDKSAAKVKQVIHNRDLHGFQNVHVYACDSRQSVKQPNDRSKSPSTTDLIDLASMAPPYPGGQFDRVLLDAPCSALGQRPQFRNSIKMKELQSFPRVQRKLFQAAVEHVRPGGTLIYSTCTLNYEENQRIVEWASEQDFSRVLSPVPVSAWNLDPGLLDTDQPGHQPDRNFALFGHPSAQNGLHDTIGFFIAKYIKL